MTQSQVEVSQQIRTLIDELYAAACKHGTTYETVVHTTFCESMRDQFGEDEHASDSAPAFAYARDAYGYLDAEEQEGVRQADLAKGICSHGLDWLTCPAGCFED